jgi:hypothetical protein
VEIEEVAAARFAHAFAPVAASPLWGPFLIPYTVDDFRAMRCFLACEGRVGGAIRPTRTGNELVSLFNNAGPPGSGGEMVERLVEGGARRLDCIGDFLRMFYGRFGFEVIQTLGWDESQAPLQWDYLRWGRPNVYVMEWGCRS